MHSQQVAQRVHGRVNFEAIAQLVAIIASPSSTLATGLPTLHFFQSAPGVQPQPQNSKTRAIPAKLPSISSKKVAETQAQKAQAAIHNEFLGG